MTTAYAEKDMPYLDNAATTRPYPSVITRITKVLREDFGNASAPYGLGHRAKAILEESRATIAQSLHAQPEEVFFTSGGTEANNLAIRGAFLAALPNRDAVVTTTLEHPSVTKSIRDLRRQGHAVSYVSAPHGALDLDALGEALGPRCALISVMQVQNVFGYRFPVHEAVRLRNEYAPHALLHSDAVQAYGKLDLDPGSSGIDLMTMSAHKVGGPKGVGALYVRTGTKMFTTSFGGGQEDGLRSGTEAIPLIAGFAEAVRITFAQREKALRLYAGLKGCLETSLRTAFEDVVVNSRPDGIPSIVHFSLPGIDNEKAVKALSDQGIYVGISAACDTNHIKRGEPVRKKHPTVTRLAGVSAKLERNSFRISFSKESKRKDIDALIDALKQMRDDGHNGR